MIRTLFILGKTPHALAGTKDVKDLLGIFSLKISDLVSIWRKQYKSKYLLNNAFLKSVDILFYWVREASTFLYCKFLKYSFYALLFFRVWVWRVEGVSQKLQRRQSECS